MKKIIIAMLNALFASYFLFCIWGIMYWFIGLSSWGGFIEFLLPSLFLSIFPILWLNDLRTWKLSFGGPNGGWWGKVIYRKTSPIWFFGTIWILSSFSFMVACFGIFGVWVYYPVLWALLITISVALWRELRSLKNR